MPPTARRSGLNLILIKSNKYIDERIISARRERRRGAAVLFRGGPVSLSLVVGLRCTCAELSQTVSFSDFSTREMQLKADIGRGPPRVHLNYYGSAKMFVAKRTEELPPFINGVAD